jgi:hypothetical protein
VKVEGRSGTVTSTCYEYLLLATDSGGVAVVVCGTTGSTVLQWLLVLVRVPGRRDCTCNCLVVEAVLGVQILRCMKTTYCNALQLQVACGTSTSTGTNSAG